MENAMRASTTMPARFNIFTVFLKIGLRDVFVAFTDFGLDFFCFAATLFEIFSRAKILEKVIGIFCFFEFDPNS